ncbi:MAG: metallophosphoesterase [Opitutaceae bacterium]
MTAEPRLQFIQINDIHYRDCRHELDVPTYAGANVRAGWLLEALRKPGLLPPADFILAIGDLIHGESLTAAERECPFMAAAFNELPVEVFPVIGNHEVKQNEGDPKWELPFKDAFSVADHYSFEREGIAFIVFNNAGTGEQLPRPVRERRFANLKRLLDRHRGQPKIIACHVPLVCLREETILAASMDFPSYKCLEPEILEAIEAESDSVLAVLSGHIHITGTVIQKGICHLAATGPASFPHDIVHFAVFDDRIEVNVIQLPSHLWQPETNIHGARRHGRDFTDGRHPNHLAYLMGNPDERSFTLCRSTQSS